MVDVDKEEQILKLRSEVEIYKAKARDYKTKLKCIDEKVNISGDFNSNKARSLKLVFEKCDQEKLAISHPESTCKTDAEIATWLQRKFVIVLSNQ